MSWSTDKALEGGVREAGCPSVTPESNSEIVHSVLYIWLGSWRNLWSHLSVWLLFVSKCAHTIEQSLCKGLLCENNLFNQQLHAGCSVKYTTMCIRPSGPLQVEPCSIFHILKGTWPRPLWQLRACESCPPVTPETLKSVSRGLITPPVGEERKIQYFQFSLLSSMQRPECQQETAQINVRLYTRTSLMSWACQNRSQLDIKARDAPGAHVKVASHSPALKIARFSVYLLFGRKQIFHVQCRSTITVLH